MTLWGESKDGKFQFLSLTKDRLEGALNVMRKSFFINENISMAVELYKYPNAIKELEELCLRAGRDGISLIAVEKATGQVACAAFNKLQVPALPGEENYFEKYEANCKEPSAKRLVRFMIESDAEFDLFEHFKVDCLAEIMFIATMPEYKRHGLSTALFECTIKLCRKLLEGENVKVSINDEKLPLQPVPHLVSAICTSFITTKIATNLKFKICTEIPYSKWEFEGKSFAERIAKDSPNSVLVAYPL